MSFTLSSSSGISSSHRQSSAWSIYTPVAASASSGRSQRHDGEFFRRGVSCSSEGGCSRGFTSPSSSAGPPRSPSRRGTRRVALRRRRRARRRHPPRDRPHSGRGSRARGRRRRRSGRCGRPRRPGGRKQELQVLVQDASEPGVLLRRRERPRLAALR